MTVPHGPTWVRLLRCDQWVKNTFVFSGLIFSGRGNDPALIAYAIAAFGVFSAVASAGYLNNDISDREADREHPEKRHRPIAAGEVGVPTARVIQVVLLVLGFGGAALLSPKVLALVVVYVAMNLAYSKVLKHMVVVDVMVIATGFVMRVLVGCYAVDATASVWLLLCTFLIALFLGFAKRRSELIVLGERHGSHRPVLGNYDIPFLDQMISVVSAVTIVCYIMYTLSPDTEERHSTTNLVYTVPFVLHGLFRYDYLLYRQNDGGNPTAIVLRDVPLIVTVAAWIASCVLILYWP